MIWTRWQAPVYRMHHPRWAYAPNSGEGARHKGGRFNPPGLAALYTSTQIECAINEASQGFPFKIQPMTLVSYTVDHDHLVDLRTPAACEAAGIDPADLACAWERVVIESGRPASWRVVDPLIKEDVGGIIVPSFAPGARACRQEISRRTSGQAVARQGIASIAWPSHVSEPKN